MAVPEQKPGRSRQNYETPAIFIEAVKARLGISAFAIDLAADDSNSKALLYFDEALDALSVPEWEDYIGPYWAWLNPPYADIGPWARKCAETVARSDAKIAFLVPAGVGANWYRDYVHGRSLVLALNGRLAFIEGRPSELYPKDCVLCLYGAAISPGFEVWTWKTMLTNKAVA